VCCGRSEFFLLVECSCAESSVRKRHILTIQNSIVKSKTKYYVSDTLLLHFLNVYDVLCTGDTRIIC
jgi:hypothetical protein